VVCNKRFDGGVCHAGGPCDLPLTSMVFSSIHNTLRPASLWVVPLLLHPLAERGELRSRSILLLYCRDLSSLCSYHVACLPYNGVDHISWRRAGIQIAQLLLMLARGWETPGCLVGRPPTWTSQGLLSTCRQQHTLVVAKTRGRRGVSGCEPGSCSRVVHHLSS
jgi:hypothetical protein